ncbi:hypothetical protein [Prevotella sp. E2-28]|uniref:hypothetical protein n=1 Tax=Prevotella sp. E2-28 TaxID=2913620 RepID=UPI001EDA0C5E|nr:hypothetical protein [Prevotella sp. E2-28]UKK52698.1 hypothetical protein L6465_08780 [Prevotella sp. E2-28]
MKVETRERTNVVKYNVYVAYDGREFNDEEECKKYEESAYGVLNAKYQKLIIKSASEGDVFDGIGTDDHTTELVKIDTQADADVVMQMFLLINSHLTRENAPDSYKKYIARADELVQYAYNGGGPLMIGRGCEYNNSFWIIGTFSSFTAQLAKFFNDDAENVDK